MTDLELNVKLRHGLTMFLDSIRDYENENRSLICDDERDSLEFVDIFFESQDAFDFIDIMSAASLSKLPEKLTAENGAKDLLIGEFHETIEHGKNDEVLKIPVSWDNIKSIYKKIVSHYCT